MQQRMSTEIGVLVERGKEAFWQICISCHQLVGQSASGLYQFTSVEPKMIPKTAKTATVFTQRRKSYLQNLMIVNHWLVIILIKVFCQYASKLVNIAITKGAFTLTGISGIQISVFASQSKSWDLYKYGHKNLTNYRDQHRAANRKKSCDYLGISSIIFIAADVWTLEQIILVFSI